MKILIISKENILMTVVNKVGQNYKYNIDIYNQNLIPLDVVTYAFSHNPQVLILDDDLLKPNSAAIIKSFRKMKPDTSIIFFTSNSSVELGRDISQLGIQYYGIKPLSESEIQESIISISKLINKKSIIHNK